MEEGQSGTVWGWGRYEADMTKPHLACVQCPLEFIKESSRGSGHTRGGKGSFDTEVRGLESVYPKLQYTCSAESAELCRKRDLSSNKFR